MAFHRNPADDPFLKQGGANNDSDDSASEGEDLRLRPDKDLLILAARNEDDVSYLEVSCGAGFLSQYSSFLYILDALNTLAFLSIHVIEKGGDLLGFLREAAVRSRSQQGTCPCIKHSL